jgi:hypothetical protein
VGEGTTNGSRWSLWSEDSVLSIGSKGSFLSIGSIGSACSIGSVGSFLCTLGALALVGDVLRSIEGSSGVPSNRRHRLSLTPQRAA